MKKLTRPLLNLQSFAIEPKWIESIGQAIILGHTNRTEYDALNAGGTYAYLGGVRKLREEFCSQGWTKETRNGIELVTSTKHQISIGISSADENVGNRTMPSKTKNPKGTQFDAISHQNQQYSFWPDEPSFLGTTAIWLLLYHFSQDQLLLELSLPNNYNWDSHKIDSWKERIFIAPIPIDPTFKVNEMSSLDLNEEYQVTIKKR